jgi:hypothetical protein
VPVKEIIEVILPIIRGLNHGIDASIFTTEAAKVNREGQTGDCSDPTLPDYDTVCRGDFSRYDRRDITTDTSLNILSTVTLPDLPPLPNREGCAGAAAVVTGVYLEGRGIIPLGFSGGIDVIDIANNEQPDCKINGVEEPFGPVSPPLDDGQVPLVMAPPHSGAEGGQLLMVVLALDPENLAADTNNFQASAMVRRVNQVRSEETVTETFPTFLKAQVSRSAGTVSMSAFDTGATMTLTSVEGPDKTWIIYAPASSSPVQLPAINQVRQTLENASTTLMVTLGTSSTYAETFTLGSGKTVDRLVDVVDTVAIQICAPTAGHPCELVD